MEEFGHKAFWPYGIERRAQFASKFDEWSLCLSEEDLPPDAASLLRTLDYPEAREEDIASGNSRGRPRKIEAAYAAYRELYPSGHNAVGHTWKGVAKGVSDHLGYKVSVDTLQTAVKEAGARPEN
jgi:hypothetical protein